MAAVQSVTDDVPKTSN